MTNQQRIPAAGLLTGFRPATPAAEMGRIPRGSQFFTNKGLNFPVRTCIVASSGYPGIYPVTITASSSNGPDPVLTTPWPSPSRVTVASPAAMAAGVPLSSIIPSPERT